MLALFIPVKGSRLGNYNIIEKLGEGGMGEVWRARDERLNRSVAVKILPPDVASDPTRRARFEQEARALGALNHPNIVAVYDSGQDNGQAYIVSELVEGESLRAVIDRGRLPVRKVVEIGVQIADALAAAHAAGIIHRDLKPENIMITRDGRAKVLDFGLAKQNIMGGRSEDQATMALSQPGMVMGTVGYMSPEQVRGETVDNRTDIFSFGCILYEMLSGKRAFQAPTSVETMNAVLHEDPPELSAEPAGIPPALAVITRRCLEKSADRRFHSAADLAFALRSASGTSASGSVPVIAEEKPRASRSRWLWPAAAAACAILFFIAGFYVRGRTVNHGIPSFQRVTFRKGLVTNARFSPDGQNVVFSASWEGGPGRVYLTTPGNPEARDLGLPDNSALLSVSSKDGIAFLQAPFGPSGTGALARTSVSGGMMRPEYEDVMEADFTPDAGNLAIMRLVDGKARIEMPPGHVLADVKDVLHVLRVAPDGEHVAYAHFYRNNSVGITVLDRSGKAHFLGAVSGETPSIVDPAMAWTPDSREIWFRSFDVREWGTVYAIDMAGRRRVVARFPGHVTLYDIARDGRLLLRTDTRQIGILGVGPGANSEKDISCLDQAALTGISDDGSMIAATIIGESGGPRGSVYVRKTDGSPPVRLGDGAAFALSPDGKWVSAFSDVDGSKRRYALLPTGAGEEREISVPKLQGMNITYGWSRDDETLFLHGPDGRDGMRNYLWTFNSGALRPFGPEGVADDLPILSPDRQQVLDRGPDRRWWIYRVDGGPGRPLDLDPKSEPVGWREDNRSLWVVTRQDRNTIAVSILDISASKMTPWKEIHPSRPVDDAGALKITPDGKAYAYNYRLKSSDLYVASGVK